MAVGLLGIMKAGAAYLPLDPAYPADRLAYMLEDSGARLLITHHHTTRPAPADIQVIDLNAERETLAQQPTTAPRTTVTPDDLAYVIYTSGSTGRPKGVAIEHHTVLHLLANSQPLYGFGPQDVWTVFHSYAFDFSVWELWGALTTGARAVIVPHDTARNPEAMWHLLTQEKVTLLSQTPSMFRELVGHGPGTDALDADVQGLPDLRWIVFGGEALEPKHIQPWFDRYPDARTQLINMYGITETTVHVTHQVITTDHLAQGGRLPAGRPLPGYQVRLLDPHGNPVPTGVPGEIYVAGNGLARGYLHRPQLTAERFTANPHHDIGTSVGTRMYRSGDLARWLPDGTLEHLGRADDQVKVRGYRIELGEIETALTTHPHIHETLVTTHHDHDGHRRLLAYLVTDTPLTPAQLRTHLAATLPDHMIPALYIPLDRLPLTPSGKVDRRALPQPDTQTEPTNTTEHTPPRTPTEHLLATTWATVLGTEEIGIHDNFFDLGGDSILSIQVVSHVRRELGARLSPRLLFAHPTVAELAVAVDAADADEAGQREASTVPRAPRSGLLPMSFGQQRLWFLEDFNEGSTEYHSAVGLRLTGRLDTDALRAATSDLVARHEALRTTFDMVDGQGVQTVHPVLPAEWRVEEAADEQEARVLAQRELERPYDLRNGPLVRVLVVRLGEAEHVCLLGMHHIVTDGWSMGVVAQELGELYTARVQGRPHGLPEVAVQYPDFAAWQRGRLEDGGLLGRRLDWWREELQGITPLELPTDRPRPAVRTSRGAVVGFEVPAATVDGLKKRARAQDATLFMALTAAVKALFARYTGEQDIAVGTASAGRNEGGLEGLVGFLVNTVVLRTRIDPEASFDALLGQVRGTVLDAFAHEDVPFERLVEAVQPERDTSRTPLVQAMVVLQNAPGTRPGLGDLDVTDYPLERDTALFDLTIEFEEHAGGLRALVEYSAELFEEETVARLGDHLNHLLAAAVADPARPVATLPLLAEGERERVVREWAGTEGVAPWPGTLHSQVAERAAEHPEAVAVVCGEDALTYGELDRSANQLAHHLISLGAGPGHLVGLSVERSTDMAVGLLGIMKAGAAYLPLDPAYPADRLAYMLEDSGARLLITHHHTTRPAPAGIQVIDLNAERETLAQQPTTAPSTTVTPDDLAYVIYTSGSTGRPKGVAIEHHTVLHLLANSQPLYGFGPQDVWTVFHSYAFDFSVWELWGALTTGARAVIVPHDTARNPEAMWHLLKQEKVTLLSQTPSMFRELVGQAAETSQSDLPDLRWIVFGGEALEPKHIQPWFDRYPDAPTQLINMYGITETTVHVTHQVITTDHLAQGGRLPAGRPLPGYQVRLLDPHGNPVPTGVPGEIYVAGNGLARGYLHRPQLTAERFTANPHHDIGTSVGTRMYRSGDLARWLPDGTLEHLGRADDQVKVRGYRIELGEIETALTTHPHIHETLVTTHHDHDGHRRLLAYLVTDTPLTPAQLRTHLAATLPDHMIPALYIPLDRLPLTPSGKVDRRALPQPDTQTEPTNTTEHTPPRTPTEHLLATTWATVLGTEEIGIHDNFFDLGGDSILSIQVVSHVRRELGARLSPRLLFAHPTVAELAVAVDAADADEAGQREASTVPRAPRSGLLPMSFGQQRLWFLEDFNEGSTEYHSAVGLRLTGRLDTDALRAATSDLVARHEALRTTFDMVDGQGVQTVHPVLPAEWRVEEAADEQEARVLAQRELERPYDLRNGPLVRVLVVRLGEAEHVCLLGMHHIVTDGWSMGVVAQELGELYTARVQGRPHGLPEVAVQYPDFAAWQRGRLEDGGLLGRRSTGGARSCRASRRSNSPPTGRGRPCAPRGEPSSASRCRPPPWTASRSGPGPRTPRSSWR
ncbi:hypothetical protein MTP06_50170 [Streptomyces sp. PLM4]|nr:hypothetical protein MTP06_50170 [Streptomyces sp. PLM4]